MTVPDDSDSLRRVPLWVQIVIGAVAALAVILMFSAMFGDAPIADQPAGDDVTPSLTVQTPASEAALVVGAATDAASWQAVSATELDDGAENRMRNIHVAVGGGWSAALAEQITTELWDRVGYAVRIEYRCELTGDYLGYTEQHSTDDYAEMLTPNGLCP